MMIALAPSSRGPSSGWKRSGATHTTASVGAGAIGVFGAGAATCGAAARSSAAKGGRLAFLVKAQPSRLDRRRRFFTARDMLAQQCQKLLGPAALVPLQMPDDGQLAGWGTAG